jgi:hypothetical protein
MAKEPQKTFEQNMEAMSKMTQAQMQAKIKELDKICVCGKCPTYIGTGEKKLTFCAIGKSTIIKKDKGWPMPYLSCPEEPGSQMGSLLSQGFWDGTVRDEMILINDQMAVHGLQYLCL